MPLGILQLALKFLNFLLEFMNLLVIVVNNFSQVGLLVGKISCVSSSTFKLQSDRSGTISFDNLFDDSFDNSSKTTAGVDNFRDALFEAVSSKFLYAGSFPLRGDFCPRDISNITFPEMLGAYLCIFTYLEVLSFVSSYRVEAFLNGFSVGN